MTSTSSEPVVLRGDLAHTPTQPVARGDLRAGTWTRLGAASVLGDAATESSLDALADRARAAASAQGYAAGWAEGRRRAQEAAERTAVEQQQAARRAADQQRAAQQSLVTALDAALAGTDAALAQRQAAVADEAVELGLRIAEAVLGAELRAVDDAGTLAVRRALAEVAPTATATVRLHPSDAAAMDPATLTGRSVTVVPDPAVPVGGALLATDVTTVDATLESALARVRAALQAAPVASPAPQGGPR